MAIAGIPPLSGMISKDEILTALWAKTPIVWAIALFSASSYGYLYVQIIVLNIPWELLEEQKNKNITYTKVQFL